MPACCRAPTATAPEIGTDLFGSPSGIPLAIAPTGFVRIVYPDGKLGAARAAARESVPIVLSTWSSVPLADAVAAKSRNVVPAVHGRRARGRALLHRHGP
ncbi:MAG: hypothetical protein CMH85_00460 [Novosphingobium sp.]|nr:hypothetical protein [Novosphingobium sp.]